MPVRRLFLSGRLKSRLASVFLRWSQTRGFMERVLTRMRLDVAGCAFLVSVFIALFLLQAESVLWRKPVAVQDSGIQSPFADPGLFLYPFEGLTADQTKGFLWIVLAVALVNAWLMDHGIRRFGGKDVQFRKWLLLLKPVLAAPPFLGFWILPIWRALMESPPAWAIRLSAPKLSLDRPLAGGNKLSGGTWRLLGSALNRLGSSKWFFALWMIPVNLLALRAGLAWLSAPGRHTEYMYLELVRWCLRCLGFLCLGYYLAVRTRGQKLPWRRRIFLGIVLLSWLLPQLSPFLMTLFIYLQAERQWIQTAVHDAFSQAGSRPANSPGPTALGDDQEIPAPFRWLLGSDEREAGSEILGKKLGFYRMKTFLLLFDTGALVFVSLTVVKQFPWLDWPLAVFLLPIIALAAVLLAVGLAARSYAFTIRYFKHDSWQRDQERHPTMRYAFLSGLAFSGGFLLGLPAAEQDAASLTRGLTYCTAVCSLQALFLIPGIFRKLSGKSEERGMGSILWLLVFQTLGGFGVEMSKSPEMTRGVTALAHGFVVLTPLWALLLWGFRGSWLLRPFRLRDIFDSQQPRKLRWNLLWIAVTSALPMGGLAIPFWIRTLRRLEEEAKGAPSMSPVELSGAGLILPPPHRSA